MAVRRTKEEIIKELEAKIQKLKEQSKVEKEVKLTKHSPGFSEAISAIENAASQNNIAVAEVIKVISRIKRTGLKFDSTAQKS